jgi:hypothetical protein
MGADLQELEPDGAAGRSGELGMAQADAAERLEQDIGEGGEPQPQLVGAHGGRRGAIGEQIELLAAPGRPPKSPLGARQALIRFSTAPRAQ